MPADVGHGNTLPDNYIAIVCQLGVLPWPAFVECVSAHGPQGSVSPSWVKVSGVPAGGGNGALVSKSCAFSRASPWLVDRSAAQGQAGEGAGTSLCLDSGSASGR
jgi:hypothetical protein